MSKKVLILALKKLDIINHSDFYGSYKDLYLSEKECGEKLLQGIQSAYCLKVWTGERKADGTLITNTTKENAIKKIFGERFVTALDFGFFKHL